MNTVHSDKREGLNLKLLRLTDSSSDDRAVWKSKFLISAELIQLLTFEFQALSS